MRGWERRKGGRDEEMVEGTACRLRMMMGMAMWGIRGTRTPLLR